jgi:branched-chain amino acid transport system permease protein
MSWDVYANVVIGGILTGLVYGLMALGLTVIFGVVRVVNFAHGEMMMVAMYLTVLASGAWGIDPLWLMVPLAALLFVLGYALQSLLVHPFMTRPDHAQFMLLVAVGMILTNGALMLFGPDARGVQVDYALDSLEFGPLLVDKVRLYAALAAVAASAALFAFFRLSATGKAIRACADNYRGALVVGLDVRRLFALAFGCGTACVGAAGAMLVLLGDVTPSLGPSYTLLAFVIVIVGGLGSMGGALAAGVLIGVSEALAGLVLVPSMKSMVSFGLLILVLLFRPQGLLGRSA